MLHPAPECALIAARNAVIHSIKTLLFLAVSVRYMYPVPEKALAEEVASPAVHGAAVPPSAAVQEENGKKESNI